MTRIAVIGAGIAGLSCARTLAQAGHRAVIFDKGRGIGGRVATRRAAGMQFDHGAQYVSAKGAGFAGALQDLAESGAIAPWDDGSGRDRMVGLPGMSGLARGLAAGLDIRHEEQVSAITREGAGWSLRVGAQLHHAAHVVVTVPAPQVPGLLGDDHPLAIQVRQVRFAPCLALMAVVAGHPPFVARRDAHDALAWIAQDSSKPGRPAGDGAAWVAHAGTDFSVEHLERDPADISGLMVPMLCDRLGADPGRVLHAAAHRWRYAHVTDPLGQPFLRNPAGTLHLGGDWCLGPRVESAWTSGTALAHDLIGCL